VEIINEQNNFFSLVRQLFGNHIFLTTIISFASSQILKSILCLFSGRKTNKDALAALVWSTGGMPSSHSALVASMAVSTALFEGIGSTIFVIALFLAFIVIRDALGVRRAAGMHAKALNELGRNTSAKFGFEWRLVKEIQGHTPLEVTAGSMLGIVIAVIVWSIVK
jgi:acid phosphatase family membrane protein YuiD